MQFRVRTARADGGQWRDPVKMAEKRERKQLKQAAKKLAEQEKMRSVCVCVWEGICVCVCVCVCV